MAGFVPQVRVRCAAVRLWVSGSLLPLTLCGVKALIDNRWDQLLSGIQKLPHDHPTVH